MAQIFDAGEVFEMAIKMEQNGAAFYREAAEKVADDQHKTMLLELVKMEEEHEKTFTALRQSLGADTADYYDPSGDAAGYLKSIADTKIFFKREIDLSSMKEILKEAVMAEQDSIVFYLGMKEMVPDDAGKAKIEAIIREEMGHVRLLNEKLLAL